MEMSPNKSSLSPLLLWLLWLLFFMTSIIQTTDSAPTSESSLLVNTTLLFDGGAPGYNLQNCSCSTPVQECNEALANSLCICHTVLRSALPLSGLRDPGRLTIWVKDFWVLEELLNRSRVGHLQLSFCGIKPMGRQYLALLGLQTLRIHSSAPEAPYPDQEITIFSAVELEALSLDLSSFFFVTILDVAVLNGLSNLKAYSVVGPHAYTFSQHFPQLAILLPLLSSATPDDLSEQDSKPLQSLLITFVY
ncbi:exosomal polycystin-1-interacting protein [Paralichthys olivaceus]|uniref:exosomal polycystin-1-interacting protein n=1 Tax=Paralichthys olivaceus TaxID=8255 RepID=UPI003750CF05